MADIGRPTDYRPEFVARVKELCLGGATIDQIADDLGVSKQTIYNWRAIHPDFLDAIRVNKEVADSQIERSLYERAHGFVHESVKIFCNKDGEVTQVPYREYIPPDPTSMIFWLKNRKPGEWRDKRDVEVSGSIKSILVPERIATERSKDVKPEFE